MIDTRVRALYYLFLGKVPSNDMEVLRYISEKFFYLSGDFAVIESVLKDLLNDTWS